MMKRKISPVLVGVVALLLVATAVAVGWRVVNGDNSLLRNVAVQHQAITPNADGDQDATRIEYEISRNATVSILFEDENGEAYYFRREKLRGQGEYQVLFSGVVDGFRLPDETIEGEILARLLPDGEYTWRITAVDDNNVRETAEGPLTIADADDELPELRNFTLDRHTFTPNRDGIDDRVLAQFFLTKDVEKLRVFLQMPDGREMPIRELEQDVPALERGRHYYDYEGGVDNDATPPPDGTYPIVAIAEDAEGQKVRVEDELTIALGGVPRALIFSPPTGDTLRFDATAVVLCDTLTFTVTIENYGNTPIRTSGPPPGTTYDSDWNYNTLGWHTESGVWRVGIGHENELKDYPYRWAVGGADDLEEIDGQLYLMPGERTLVTGSIRIVDSLGERNPQPIWAGLIHEDVAISQFNRRVDPHDILIDLPDPDNIEPCPEREIPLKPAEP